MEIKINIDENCKFCKQGIKYLKKLQKRHPNHYANMNMKDYTLIEGVYLTPDFNCSGFLTHFHMIKGDKETLKTLIEGIEAREKESKVIMEAKRDMITKHHKEAKCEKQKLSDVKE